MRTLIPADEDCWKDREHTREINVWGGTASAVLPVLVFLLLLVV